MRVSLHPAKNEWQWRLVIGVNIAAFAWNAYYWIQTGLRVDLYASIMPLVAALFTAWFYEFFVKAE